MVFESKLSDRHVHSQQSLTEKVVSPHPSNKSSRKEPESAMPKDMK